MDSGISKAKRERVKTEANIIIPDQKKKKKKKYWVVFQNFGKKP